MIGMDKLYALGEGNTKILSKSYLLVPKGTITSIYIDLILQLISVGLSVTKDDNGLLAARGQLNLRHCS